MSLVKCNKCNWCHTAHFVIGDNFPSDCVHCGHPLPKPKTVCLMPNDVLSLGPLIPDMKGIDWDLVDARREVDRIAPLS